MEDLLLQWGFDELVINNFLEHDVDIGQLNELTDDHLKELAQKIGDRIRLKQHIRSYIKANEEEEEQISKNMHEYKNVKKSFDCIKISEILTEYAQGRQILAHFTKEKTLTPTHRTKIVQCIVHYLVEQLGAISADIFEQIAEKIVKYFPGEDKDTYFKHGELTNGKRAHHKGKLIDRYYNIKRGEPKAKRQASAEAADTISEAVEPRSSDDLNLDIELKKIKNILFHKRDESEENINGWKITFPLRRSEFLATDKGCNTENVIENWPMLKTSFGKKLIELDFEEIYPLKRQCIFEKWTKFIDGIKKVFCEVKDETGLKHVKVLTDGNLSAETYDFYILYVLPYILQPVVRLKVGKKQIKPSFCESRDAFIVKVNTIDNLQVWLDGYTASQKKRGLSVQPLIIGVGIDEIKEFFVVCGEIKYKCSSILAALNTCFQVHVVLRTAFSLEAVHIWLLIQKFFFEIDTEFDLSLTNVNALLTTLNN